MVKSNRLSAEEGPLQGAPDWLIDMQRQQIWVWENQKLPLIYAGADSHPTLGNISGLTANTVMAMTQQR